MVTPIFILTQGFGISHPPRVENGQANRSAKAFTAMAAFDLGVFITSLAVGILGATGTIHLPSALSFSLIGVSGLVVLSYGIMVCKGVYLAQISSTTEPDGSRPFISHDIKGHFQIIPKVFGTICA